MRWKSAMKVVSFIVRAFSCFAGILVACPGGILQARAETRAFEPDTIVFKNGAVIRGLIIKATPLSVVVQMKQTERTFARSEILRIRDEANTGIYFADVHRQGSLPAWRAIANDLRTLDEVKKLEEISATVREEGPFRKVPYVAFRVNSNIELNIYGDPEDPAGIEMGIYGPESRNREMREAIRSFLASFLFSRAEIGALYRLGEGEVDVGEMRMKIQEFGVGKGWWIALYHPSRIQRARLGAREYSRLTAPTAGRHRGSHRAEGREVDARIFLRGFYRDDDGVFRLP